MLKLWRRHLATCPHAQKGRKYLKCSCPIWADGMLDGKRVRKSLDTLNWQRANEIARDMEADDGEEKPRSSVSDGIDDFVLDCEDRNLGSETIQKYRETLEPLRKWCQRRSITELRSLDYATLKSFVREIKDSPLTKGKKIERLRTFFTYCENENWVESNPARKIKKPKVTNKPVVPFSAEEYKAILAAIDKYPTKNSFGYDQRKRICAFIYILRYAAFRVSDAVQLKKVSVSNGKVFIRTMKTGAAVRLPVPPFVLKELDGLGNETYFFWTGNGNLKSAKADWQRTISKLFELAGVKGHPHMFRHMLAIELLENGTPVEHVAAILGNSPAIVYKHYAPWVQSRQVALEQSLLRLRGPHSQ